MTVDVYPVGILKDLMSAWRFLTVRKFPAAEGPPSPAWRLRQARISLSRIPKAIGRHVRDGDWRALKNTFNGYLAEPSEFPVGEYRRRCGAGWTKRRALRSLQRRIRMPGVYWDELNRQIESMMGDGEAVPQSVVAIEGPIP